jgi:DNA-binding transcriptional LysR family regulator
VAAGIGVSILPECYLRAGVGSVVARSLETPDAEIRLMVAVRSTNASLLARRFVDCALQVSSRLQQAPQLDQASAPVTAAMR